MIVHPIHTHTHMHMMIRMQCKQARTNIYVPARRCGKPYRRPPDRRSTSSPAGRRHAWHTALLSPLTSRGLFLLFVLLPDLPCVRDPYIRWGRAV